MYCEKVINEWQTHFSIQQKSSINAIILNEKGKAIN